MKQPVVIKANNYGLMIMLNPDLEFEELLKEVGDKFKESAKFFGNVDMAVSFDGRKLSADEEESIIQTILKNSSIHIVCTIDNDPVREAKFKKKLEQISISEDTSLTKIHKGYFRSGQMMEFDTGVVIIGDINPGAKVVAKGSIVVLGALKGEAEAGAGGNDDTFIIALDMNPIQLRIGSKIARCADNLTLLSKSKCLSPQVAFVENDNICIEDLNKNVLDSLKL